MQERRHKLIVLGLVVLLVAAVLASGVVTGCHKPNPVVSEWNIPQITIMTGPGALFGLEAVWGAAWAAKDINEAGGIRGLPIKFTLYDTEFDPAKAVTVMARVVDREPLIIYGPFAQSGVEAAGDIAVEAGIPFIASLPSPKVREEFAPWGVSHFPDTGEAYVVGVVEWLRLNPDIKSLVLFYVPAFPSHVDEIEMVEEALEGQIEIVGKVEVTWGTLDLGSVAIKALGMHADGYYSVLNAEEHACLAKALYEHGMTEGRRLCAGGGASGMSLYELGEGFLEDTYIWDFITMDYENTKWQAIVEDFGADYDGALPYSIGIRSSVDAIYAIAAAFEACEITGDPAKLSEERIKIRDFLYNANGLFGVQGNYDYVNGKKVAPMYMFQIHNNIPEQIGVLPPE